MWKNKIIKILIFVILINIIPFRIFAEDQKIVKIGYIDYAGFIEKDSNGEYKGYAVEYLNKISQYTGWKYEYYKDTWKNNLKKLEDGEIDFLLSAQYTSERSEKYLYSLYSLGIENNYLYTSSKNKDIYFNDYESMSGRKVGLLTQSYQMERFIEFADSINLKYKPVYYLTDNEMKKDLISGKIDIIASGSLFAHNDLKNVGIFGASSFYAISGRNHGEELMVALNHALGEISYIWPSY